MLDTAEELPGSNWLSCDFAGIFVRSARIPGSNKRCKMIVLIVLVQATRAFVRISSRKESWRLTMTFMEIFVSESRFD